MTQVFAERRAEYSKKLQQNVIRRQSRAALSAAGDGGFAGFAVSFGAQPKFADLAVKLGG